MSNFIAFTNMWLSYFLVFLIFIAVIVIAAIIGSRLRKNKDAKMALEAATAQESNNTKPEE